jgi:tetratricopeptide (TPR) repeat protein
MGEGADKVAGEESPRMRQLKQMLLRQPDDPFLLYGVAMEYKKAGRAELAIEHFDQVLRRDPNYCYAYYQRAQVHESRGDVEAAKRSLREGLEAADRSGDAHARSEIEAALALLD